MQLVHFTICMLSIFAIHPAQADDSDAINGVVVIGVKGDFPPDFTWRPFDTSTGKLLTFNVVQNVASETKKQLSSLFSDLGRLGRRDKRYKLNKAGVSYRMAKLSPGTYVLETITTPKRWSAFQGQVPIVRVVAGQAAYVGDYIIEEDKNSGGRAYAAGYSTADASVFLAAFPKVTSPLVADGYGTATIDCRGKLVAFASQLVCDADQSLVTNVYWATP
jgi:hypothetical protein